MATKKVLYFIAGTVPDSTELADIAKLNAAAEKPYEVTVLTKTGAGGSYNYGEGRPAPADYASCKSGGSIPAAFSGLAVLDPANPPAQNLPTTQAVVANGQKLTASGSGAVATVVVNPTTKVVTVTLAAS